jgi:hypothetical protein
LIRGQCSGWNARAAFFWGRLASLFGGGTTWSLGLCAAFAARSSATAWGPAGTFATSSGRSSALSGTHTLSGARRQCPSEFHEFIATEFAIAIGIEGHRVLDEAFGATGFRASWRTSWWSAFTFRSAWWWSRWSAFTFRSAWWWSWWSHFFARQYAVFVGVESLQ